MQCRNSLDFHVAVAIHMSQGLAPMCWQTLHILQVEMRLFPYLYTCHNVFLLISGGESEGPPEHPAEERSRFPLPRSPRPTTRLRVFHPLDNCTTRDLSDLLRTVTDAEVKVEHSGTSRY